MLDYLRTLQNDRNDFATISKKLVTLFTLLSGQRVSTLHKFKRSMMQVLPDRIIFHLSGNLKQSRPANPPEPIIFHQYPHDGELCPVAAFRQYHLTCTAIVGNQFDDSIFLCHRKPNAPATIDTLARWVKQSNDCCWYRHHYLSSPQLPSSIDLQSECCWSPITSDSVSWTMVSGINLLQVLL